MKNILIMTLFTVREALARKVFVFFLAISLFVFLLLTIFLSFTDTETIIAFFSASGGPLNLGDVVMAFEIMIITPLATLCLFLAIFSSASFVPVMLEKGNIDLLLSKPVSRNQLLLGKYFGGLLVVLINIIFLILGTWLIISVKFNFWSFSLLWIILTITFTFAVLYSLIVFFGVLTRSSIPGMMTAYLIFIILSPILTGLKNNMETFIASDFLRTLIDGLYYITPKTAELMGKISLSLASGNGIENFQPVISSFLFLILAMTLSLLMFKKKDF